MSQLNFNRIIHLKKLKPSKIAPKGAIFMFLKWLLKLLTSNGKSALQL